MATGTDVAIQTAGITLMRSDLGLVVDAIALSSVSVVIHALSLRRWKPSVV